MHKMLLITALLLPITAFAAEPAAAPAPVVQPAAQAWLDLARKDAQEAGNTIDEKALTAALQTNELLVEEALRLSIDKQPDYAVRLEMKRRELLANLVVKDHLAKNPPGDAMLKAEYERIKAQSGNKEYSARHILLKTEDEAKEVIAQLAKGADFAILAKAKSQDAASRENGGLIDWVGKNGLKAPIGDALAKLQKGLYTTIPLQTDTGWHVLKLEGVRDFKMPPYDQIREPLRQRMKTQQASQYIASLRSAKP